MLFSLSFSCLSHLIWNISLSFIQLSPIAVTVARSRAWTAAAGFLGLRIWIPPRIPLFVCSECCVLSGSVIAERQQWRRLCPLELSSHEKKNLFSEVDSVLSVTSENNFNTQTQLRGKTIFLKILILISLEGKGENKGSIPKSITYFPGKKIGLWDLTWKN